MLWEKNALGNLDSDVRTIEDELLKWRFRRGSRDVLCRIYDRYRHDLLRLAVALSNDGAAPGHVTYESVMALARQVGEATTP